MVDMDQRTALRYAGFFFILLELAIGITLIFMAVINYDLFFLSLVDMERFQLLLFLGVFIPAGAAVAFGIVLSIFSKQAWKNEKCQTLVGNVKVPKAFVVLIDALIMIFLLTGIWDLTTSFLYLNDGGGMTDVIPALRLLVFVMDWEVWAVILLGGVKTAIGVALIIREARYWIGQDKICSVLFKPVRD